jgi:hypothetical protein
MESWGRFAGEPAFFGSVRTMLKFSGILCAIAVAAALLAPDARAESQEVTLEISAPFPTASQNAAWLPLNVTLKSNVRRESVCEVRCRMEDWISNWTVVRQERVPPMTARQFTIPIPRAILRRAYYQGNSGVSIKAELWFENADAPASTRNVAVNLRAEPVYLVLERQPGSMVSATALAAMRVKSSSQNPPGQRYQGGRGQFGPLQTVVVPEVISPDPRVLPDSWIGYDGVDCIVVNDFPFDVLTDAQRTAMLHWVLSGGTMMVIPGRDPAWLKSGFVADLLKGVKITEGQARSLDSGTGAPFRPANPLTICETSGGQVLLQAKEPAGARLLCGHPVGSGTVLFVGVDLGNSAIAGWPGAEGIWTAVINGSAGRTRRGSSSMRSAAGLFPHGSEMGTVLGKYMARMPSFLLVLCLVLIVLVILGPANWLYVRKRGRPILTVITVPAVSVLLMLGVIGAGYLVRGTSNHVGSVRVLTVATGSPVAHSRTTYCVMSASSRDFDIKLNPAEYPILMADMSYAYRHGMPQEETGADRIVLSGSGDFTLADLAVKQWDTRTFATESIVDLGGSFECRFNGNVAHVVNGTGRRLLCAALVDMDSGVIMEIGPLNPGDARDVSLAQAPQWRPGTPQGSLCGALGIAKGDAAFPVINDIEGRMVSASYSKRTGARAQSGGAPGNWAVVGLLEDKPAMPEMGARWLKTDCSVTVVVLEPVQ